MAGIRRLLTENRDYRRLWMAQVASQAGDWVSHIAVVTLLLRLTGEGTEEGTGEGTVIAYSLILRMLPWVFVAPLAGVIVDRWNRKTILITSDIVRAMIVPCFLFIDDLSDVPWVYAVVVLQVAASCFFEPARQAILPSIVARDQLLSANALSSATWSLMLALGSALGGIVISFLGLRFAFLFDATTYLVSAALLSGMRVPRRASQSLRSVGDAFRDLAAGFSYVRSEPSVSSLIMVKAAVGLSGGMVLLLTVMAERVFVIPGWVSALVERARDGSSNPQDVVAMGIGALFFARGLGTAIGPFVGRAISGYHDPAMRRLIGFSFYQAAVLFVLFAFAPGLLLALPLLVCAHIGTSINWVFSTVLLQLAVPDELRGRVFSAELLLFTLSFCVSTWCFAYALDDLGISPRILAAICGGLLVFPGLYWQVRSKRSIAAT